MPKVDELIGALEAETPLAAEGSFTLDREQARLKMRQFQLPDPRMYVLSLVQLAAVLGAKKIDFVELDSDDTIAEFSGMPLLRGDIDELYASLLGGPDASPARQELALAVNGAMALAPKFMRITSCRAEGPHGPKSSIALMCRPDVADAIEEELEPWMEPGTRIHVKEKFGLGLRFLDSLFGDLAERVHLRDRCRWARMEVLVRGHKLSGDVPLAELEYRAEVEAEGLRVVAGFDPNGGSARIRMLCHGVWIEERDFDGPYGFRVLCDGSRFRKNVSRTGVVQDERYEEAMAVVELARQRSFAALAAELHTAAQARIPDARAIVLGEIERALDRGAKLDETAPPWLRTLAETPLWTSVVAGARASTWELAQDSDGAGYVTEPFTGLDAEWRTTVLLDPEDRDRFQRLFARRVSRTLDLQARAALLDQRAGAEARRADDRRKWRQRPHALRLSAGGWLRWRKIEAEGVQGSVGISSRDASLGRIHLVADGCLLGSFEWTDGPPSTHAVVQAAFEPTLAYDGAVADETLAHAITAMLLATRKLWRGLARQRDDLRPEEQPLLLAYLAMGERTNAAFGAYHAVGFDGQRARKLVLAHPTAPSWGLGTAKPHPIALRPLFRLLDGGRAPLVALHAHVQQTGELPVVRRTASIERAPFAVVVGAPELAALGVVFGPRAIVDRDDLVREDVHEQAQTLSEAALREALRVPTDVPVFGFTLGELSGALAFDGDRDDASATIALLQSGASIEQIRIAVPVGNVVAAIDVSGILVDRDATGVGPRARERVVAMVEHGIGVAIATLAATPGELAQLDAHRILAALRSRVRSTVWLRAYASFVQADPARADAAYVELARLSHGTYWEVLATQVAEELARGGTPWPDRIAQALRIRDRIAAPCKGLFGQLVEAMPMLARLPLWRTCRGESLGLLAIVDAATRGRLGLVAPQRADRDYDDSEGLVVVAEGLAEEVVRGLVELQITPGERLFVARERRRIAEARPIRERIAIADGAAVVATRVEIEGGRGELGLAIPTETRRSTIEICVQRRSVGAVHPELPVAVVGVIDHDALALDFAFAEDGLGPAQWRAVEHTCRRALPELLRALAKHDDTAMVAAIVRRVLLDPRIDLDDDLREAFDRLPAFAASDGRFWSRAALQACAQEQGEIDVVPLHWRGEADGPVIAVGVTELAEFRRLVGHTRDYRRLAEAQARRVRAPVPTRVPVDAIGRSEIEAAGLRGVVWIDGEAGLVELVAEGRVADRVRASSWLPVRGFVEGDAVEVAADWSRATLDGPGRAALEEAARRAYEGLVAWFEGLLRGQASGADRERARLARQALTALAVRLATGRGIGAAEAQLLARVQTMPIFEREGGDVATLEEARRERIAGAHEIWAGPDPQPGDPSPNPNPSPNPIPSPSPNPIPPPTPNPIPNPDPSPEPEPLPGTDPDPQPVPGTEPEPMPPPVQGTHADDEVPHVELSPEVARVIDRVREHLRSVFTASAKEPADAHLHRITARDVDLDLVSVEDAHHVVLNTRHPVFEAAADDHVALCLLASSAYTTLNRLREDVTDDDEARFHDVHAERILAAVATETSPRAPALPCSPC
jgi:hypothetical protein